MNTEHSKNILLNSTKEELVDQILDLRDKLEVAHADIEKLKKALDEAQRSGKRQASPFSKGNKNQPSKKPGRKSGKAHGGHHRRTIPSEIDFKIDVPIETGLMDKDGNPLCPGCHEPLEDFHVYPQYQTDIPPPPKPIVTQFNVETAKCPCCGERFQGRHEHQTSDALHAANHSIGPTILSWGAELKYGFGLSFEKVADYFLRRYRCRVSRAALCRASQRLSKKAMPTYESLVVSIQQARIVCADETGWRINGTSAWLWVFSSSGVTVYLVDPARAHAVAEKILGKKFKGILSTDGFLAYDALDIPGHKRQQCNSHLLKRCKELQELKTKNAVVFSRQVAAILKTGVALHNHHHNYTAQGFSIARGKIEKAMDRVLSKQLKDPDNARLARHLIKHRDSLFTYLYDTKHEVAPTNNEAERETRPAVITRKLGACNRSATGAQTTSILTSVIRTCKKQMVSFIDVAIDLLHSQNVDCHPIFNSSA